MPLSKDLGLPTCGSNKYDLQGGSKVCDAKNMVGSDSRGEAGKRGPSEELLGVEGFAVHMEENVRPGCELVKPAL